MESKYNMTQKENIFLAKRNIVDYIWKSANLEGIGVTYPDTQAIYNGMAVSGYTIEDINAIYDLKHAWQFLLDNISEELNLAFVRKVHMILGRYTIINSGTFRRDEVRIGGTDWIPELPDEKKAESELGNILESKTVPISKALDLTVYLMRAQLLKDNSTSCACREFASAKTFTWAICRKAKENKSPIVEAVI
jgi:hypothetical protein